jgi:hypothetical protein
LEELRTPEETSNGSIQGSLGACAGKLKCGSHRASIKEDVILGFVLLIYFDLLKLLSFCAYIVKATIEWPIHM